MFKYFLLINDKQFQPISYSMRRICLFPLHKAQYSEILRTVVERTTLTSSLGTTPVGCFIFMVINNYQRGELYLRQISNKFAQTHQKFRKVTIP